MATDRREPETPNVDRQLTVPTASVMAEMRWDRLRPGQKAAIELALDRILAGEKYTTIVLPTRYGKSHVYRAIAYIGWRRRAIAATLLLSTGEPLRDQLNDDEKWRDFVEVCQIDARLIRRRSLESWNGTQDFTRNGEWFVSTTIQLVHQNLETFVLWVQSVHHRTGLPVAVIYDECHTGGETLPWGETIGSLVEAGALAILGTATPYRSDSRPIIGFPYKRDILGETVQTVTRPSEDPEMVHIELYAGERVRTTLLAHHTTTFREAWDEEPSPLCRLSRVTFDVNLRELTEDEEERRLLSELSRPEVRRRLGKITREPRVIREAVRRFVRELRRYRAIWPGFQGIIYCGNDLNDGDDRAANQHARQIARALRETAPDLRAVIATSANDGSDMIPAFASGTGDVLIVKQMGGVGMDAPGAKVALDLSPIRTFGSYIQRIMRIATPHRGVVVATLVCLDEILGRESWNVLVTRGGGEATVTTLGDLIREYDKPREERPPEAVTLVGGADDGRLDDTDGRFGSPDMQPPVALLLDRLPVLQATTSHAEVAQALHDIQWRPVIDRTREVVEEGDTGRALQVRRDQARGLAESIASKLLRRDWGSDWPGEAFGEEIRQVWNRAKDDVGIGNVDLSEIQDVEQMEQLVVYLARWDQQLGARRYGDA